MPAYKDKKTNQWYCSFYYLDWQGERKRVKKMGKSDADKMDFWTAAEYQVFIDTVEEGGMYHVLFDTLFYTGCRIGELLALTRADINFTAQQLSISKTYYRANGEDVITKPKTENSNRVIELPRFLADELKAYTDKLYGLQDSDRIFPIIPEAVQHKLKRHVQKAGVKYIRVHDLRHSHCADLINQGVEPLLIKERLGHKDISITLNTYGHLYPNQSRRVADLLEQRRGN